MIYTLFIRTSNFEAEAERSHLFLRYEPENVLNMFVKYRLSLITETELFFSVSRNKKTTLLDYSSTLFLPIFILLTKK